MGKRTEYPTDTYAANIRAIVARATAEDVDAGMVWYPVAGELASAISARTGLDVDTVAAIISALSPRNKWARNIMDAAAYAEAGVAGAAKPRACTFYANSNKAWAIATGAPWRNILKGRKVESFVANITGDCSRVTVDVWAVRAATMGERDAVTTDGMYRAMETAYQTVAAEYGVEPAMLQAIAWVVVKRIVGKAKSRTGRVARLAA